MRLYPEAFFRIPILIPSRDEQSEITDHVEEHTRVIDQNINRAEREIELFNEYRTRLISDVVTGKLDVREVARSLPEDVSEEATELDAELSPEDDFASDEALAEELV